MADTILKGRLLKWGHSVGIRLRSKDAKRVPANLGDEITVRIESKPSTIDPTKFEFFSDTGPDAAQVGTDHDRVLAKGRARELRGRRT